VINVLSRCGNLDIETNLAKSGKFEIMPRIIIIIIIIIITYIYNVFLLNLFLICIVFFW